VCGIFAYFDKGNDLPPRLILSLNRLIAKSPLTAVVGDTNHGLVGYALVRGCRPHNGPRQALRTSIKSQFWKILITCGDKCPRNGSKNDKMAPRTTRRSHHEGPRVACDAVAARLWTGLPLTPIALSLHCHCIIIALSLHYHCIVTALSLHNHCITIALSLHYHCIIIAACLPVCG